MCNNGDCFEAYLRDKWALLTWDTLCSLVAVCAIQHRVPVMYGDPACCPKANIEGHICLQPRHWYQPNYYEDAQAGAGIGTCAPIRHPSALHTYLVNPCNGECNPSLFKCCTCNPGPIWSYLIHHYYISQHIIKNLIIMILKIILFSNHLLVLVCQILSALAISNLPVVSWLGCPS